MPRKPPAGYNAGMFKRRRPAWLIPGISLAAVLVLWVALGLLSNSEPATEDVTASGGASLLAYLSPSDGPAEVFALDFGSGQAAQLTDSGGVNAFAVSPDGDSLYVSLSNAQRGADLWLVDLTSGQSSLLLDCGLALCEGPRLSPDGARLAYQRSEPGIAYLPEIWVLDLDVGAPQRLSVAGHRSENPQWAAANTLSYYDQDEAAFVVLDLNTGANQSYANETGAAHTWHPDGRYFVSAAQTPITTDILRGPSGEAAFDTPEPGSQQPVEVLTSHLWRYAVDSSESLFDYEDVMIEDALPVFSPDGQWLAFTRKYLDEERWTPGRQLWLYNLGNGESFALSTDANYQVIAIAWSPDGQQIAFVRANQTAFQEPLELWITNLDGTASQLVAVDAYAPAWVP